VRNRTVVFDLDDTLFAEEDYVRSGVAAVLQALRDHHSISIDPLGLPREQPLSAILAAAGGGPPTMDELLSIYRGHSPVIALAAGASELIAACRRHGDAVCILTDGRSSSQRLKVEALGVDHDGLFISEEIGATKPDEAGFRAVEQAWPSQEYVYIADNPTKDFIAPNRLGWRTFGLRLRPAHVHQWTDADIPGNGAPGHWVDDFCQIMDELYGREGGVRRESSDPSR
jgi:putative hydrolase of the HAD superfamily